MWLYICICSCYIFIFPLIFVFSSFLLYFFQKFINFFTMSIPFCTYCTFYFSPYCPYYNFFSFPTLGWVRICCFWVSLLREFWNFSLSPLKVLEWNFKFWFFTFWFIEFRFFKLCDCLWLLPFSYLLDFSFYPHFLYIHLIFSFFDWLGWVWLRYI